MTTYNKSSLATFFETGDVPTGQNYSDLIDSCVNVAETSAQSLLSPLKATEFIAPRVSATNGNFTGTFAVAGNVSAASINLTGDVSAATGTVYASAVRSTNGMLCPPGVVSALGTTQAAAAILTNVINRGKGIVDGSTTGFAIPANRTGLLQYLYNEGASANLWPPTGGFINGLAVNTPFPLVASAMVTIVHLTASAYGVK